jgi:hypothetical protein
MNTWRRWCQSSRASVEKGQSAVPLLLGLVELDAFITDFAADGLLLGDGLLGQAGPFDRHGFGRHDPSNHHADMTRPPLNRCSRASLG